MQDVFSHTMEHVSKEMNGVLRRKKKKEKRMGVFAFNT